MLNHDWSSRPNQGFIHDLETAFFSVFFAIFAVELLFNQTTENAENAKKLIATTEYTDLHGKSRRQIDMDAQDGQDCRVLTTS
jgi:hypothetical protein